MLDVLLTSSLIAEMKHSAGSRLREKGFMLTHSQGYSPSRQVVKWEFTLKWEFTHMSHNQKQRAMNTCSVHFSNSYSPASQTQTDTTTHGEWILPPLTTSINAIRIIPHRHTQRLLCQVVIDLIKLTIEMNNIREDQSLGKCKAKLRGYTTSQAPLRLGNKIKTSFVKEAKGLEFRFCQQNVKLFNCHD